MKNNNNQVIKNITKRSIEHSQKLNRTIILAIILTTLMFGVVFTLTEGIMKSMRWEEQRQAGYSTDGKIENLTKEQYEMIKNGSGISDCTYYTRFAAATNKELKKRNLLLSYARPETYEKEFAKIVKGHTPVNKNEIVLDKITLRLLNLSCKLGQNITISYVYEGVSHTDNFVLSGYYEGNEMIYNSTAFCSEEYVESVVGKEEERTALVTVKYANNAEKRLTDMVTDILGKDAMKVVKVSADSEGILDAFNNAELEDKITFCMAILIIIIASYLIIHNVFMISVMKDIQFYGLFKTIGMTKEQVKKVVRKRVNHYCIIGIPTGLILGTVVGNVAVPMVLHEYGSGYSYHIGMHPIILVISIIFSYVTVQFSCSRAGRMASKVSPMKALHFMDIQMNHRKKKGKSRTKFSYIQMAKENLLRNRKKTGLVLLSLTLSLSVLMVITSVLHSISLEECAKRQISGDMIVGANDQFKLGYPSDFRKEIKQNSAYLKDAGVNAKTHALYYGCMDYTISDQAFAQYKQARKNKKINESPYESDVLNDMEKQKDKDRVLQFFLYGFDNYTIKNLKLTEGTIDYNQFLTGNYIIMVNSRGYSKSKPVDLLFNMSHMFFKVGDSVEMGGKSYKIMAYVDLPFYNTIGSIIEMPQVWGIIPHTEMKNNTNIYYDEMGAPDPDTKIAKTTKVKPILYSWLYELRDGQSQEHLEKLEKQYTNNIDTRLSFMCKSMIVKDMADTRNVVLYLGGGFTILVSVIAILNFMNNIITGIWARRKEFAMLRSVGMERKQLLHMLFAESMIYIGVSYVVALLAGSILSRQIITSLMRSRDWMICSPTVIPVLISLPVCILIGIVIPYISYKKEEKQSIVALLHED